MRLFCLAIVLIALLEACTPAAGGAGSVETEPVEVETAEAATFTKLAAPFREELRRLGVEVGPVRVYRYEGSDPNAFIEAINTFYRDNPGFCPLVEAFYPAENGVQFMTLAGDNRYNIRGFLYDQSRRPALTYAYFEGTSARVLPAISCETVGAEE